MYASYSKFHKELRNGIRILSRLIASWLIDQNIILTALIHNLKTVWPTKFSMSFLSSLDNL